MEAFLRGLLPRLLPTPYALDQNCFIRPHRGKSDLQRSLINKTKAMRGGFGIADLRLVVLHDQDANDCIRLKTKLAKIIEDNNAGLPYLIRIACKELENYYLGDFAALERTYPENRLASRATKAKYRRPDRLNGAEELGRLVPDFTKIDGGRRLGPVISLTDNRSTSFNQLIRGLQRFLAT